MNIFKILFFVLVLSFQNISLGHSAERTDSTESVDEKLAKKFDEISADWMCLIPLDSFRTEYVSRLKRKNEKLTESELDLKFVESFGDLSQEQLNAACVQSIKKNTLVGLSRIGHVNRQLVESLLTQDFGHLMIGEGYDCGGFIASGCFIPNFFFKGGTLRFPISKLFGILAYQFDELHAFEILPGCDDDRASPTIRALCDSYTYTNRTDIESVFFHETLHYLRFDNLSVQEHVSRENFKFDVIYSCTNFAFRGRGYPHLSHGEKYYFSQEQCLTCAQAARDRSGKIVNDSGRSGEVCDELDFSKYKAR